MNFGLGEEQEMIVKTVREFVETEIYPHESEVDRTGIVPAGTCPGNPPQMHRSRLLRL